MKSCDKKITVVSVSVAFIISFSLFTILLSNHHESNYISIEEQQFYSQDFPKNEKKIFILGASPVNAINADIVNDIIKKTDNEFMIYNLAKGSDDPDKRKDTLELIINNKPEIVLYGVGYRDFQEKISVNSLSDTKKVESILVDPHNFFEEYVLSEIGFYDLEFDYLKNPKLSTLQIIKSFTQEEIIKNEESEKIILNDEHPLRTPEQVKNKYVKKTDKELNIMSESLKLDLQRYGIDPEYKNRYSISLNYIIKELEKNDINVILFTHPHHKYYLESVPKQSEENFLKIIHNLRDNHDIKLELFHVEYSSKTNWSDLIHIFYNYDLEKDNEDSIDYSNDIANLILSEMQK
tara:strand:- start:40 stop:1089 length:1050 start_codon:yes stop_codon:yes gene_type:complete